MIKAVFFDIGGTVHTQDATPESDRDYKERLWRYLEEHGIRTADTPDGPGNVDFLDEPRRAAGAH